MVKLSNMKKLWCIVIVFVLSVCLLSVFAGNTLIAKAETTATSSTDNTPDKLYTDENGEPYALKDNVIYETV